MFTYNVKKCRLIPYCIIQNFKLYQYLLKKNNYNANGNRTSVETDIYTKVKLFFISKLLAIFLQLKMYIKNIRFSFSLAGFYEFAMVM